VRHRAIRPRATALFAVGALLLAACGGDDPDPVDEAPDTEAPADDDTADDDGQDDVTDDEVTEDPDDGAQDDAAAGDGAEVDPDEALRIARGFGDDLIASQVTYELSGFDEFGSSAEMIIAQDPPSTVATRIDAPDGQVLSIVDLDAGETIVCFGTGGDWECFADDGLFGDDLLEDLPGQGLEFEDQAAPDSAYRTTILAREALCLRYDELDDITDVEICVDEADGLLLRYAGEDPELGSRVALEAIDIADPDPAFFEPPVEPIGFGDVTG
jgi:hypothetical protein